jgi:hypothetical protein
MLYFGDRATVPNDFIYQTEWSMHLLVDALPPFCVGCRWWFADRGGFAAVVLSWRMLGRHAIPVAALSSWLWLWLWLLVDALPPLCAWRMRCHPLGRVTSCFPGVIIMAAVAGGCFATITCLAVAFPTSLSLVVFFRHAYHRLCLLSLDIFGGNVLFLQAQLSGWRCRAARLGSPPPRASFFYCCLCVCLRLRPPMFVL